MEFNQIKETCLYVKDLDKTKAFYHDKLGLEVISHVADRHIFFRAGSSVLLCFNPEDSKQKVSPPGHYATGKIHFAFETSPETYSKWEEKIIKEGIKIIDRVIWKNGQESFYFNDPDGHVLEIVPRGIWETS